MHICNFTINVAPNEAPRNFRNISGTSTTITFQWDRLFLFQRNRRITQYVITCSRLDGESIFTVSSYVMYIRSSRLGKPDIFTCTKFVLKEFAQNEIRNTVVKWAPHC